MSEDIKKAMNNLYSYATGKVEGGLTAACPAVLEAIFEDRTWSDDTYNLRDSFAWAIFRDGIELKRGYLNDNQMATEPRRARGEMRNIVGNRDIWGREQADAFLDEYEPQTGSTYEAVFVAGMYYAVYLEWKNLLIGFINGEEIAKEEVITYLKKSYEPIYTNKR